jgi:predicted nuclease of predicted toxin-antitoxin system
MRVLVDECAPRALKIFLAARGHDCRTVQELGWAGKQNGELLQLAEQSGFELLITVDTNLRYQQNFKNRKISALLLLSPTNRLSDLEPLFGRCAEAVLHLSPGELVIVE